MLIIAPGQEANIGTIFSFCLNMKVYRGDSNEYTQYTIFNMKKKNTLNYPKSAAMGFFPRDPRTSSK